MSAQPPAHTADTVAADYEWVPCPVCAGKGEIVRRVEPAPVVEK